MFLKHVYLTSADPEALSGFYAGLGLDVRFKDPGRWIQFEAEGAAFCIASPEESAGDIASNAVAVFEVVDLEAMLIRAGEGGAMHVGEIRDMGAHGRVAVIEDIERNIIQLFERTQYRKCSL